MLLAKHRAAVWQEVGGWTVRDLAPQVPIWAEFFKTHVADGTYVAFIAEENSIAIASGALLIHLAMPRPYLVSDRAGRVQSLFVEPAARRRGVARAIMEKLIHFADDAKLISLALRPSEDARGLYVDLGFQVADELIYRLTQN
jgi:GNAT superfamily N-acetyltransferase